METKTFSIFKIILVPLLLATIVTVYIDLQIPADSRMLVSFFDVGQGDSILITTYQGNHVLIDGGPGHSVLQNLGQTMPLLDKQIEMMILTHPHLDHLEGLIQVLRRYDVKKVVMPNVEHESASYQEFIRAVEQEGSQIIYARQGLRVWLDDSTVFDVLHPVSDTVWDTGKNDDLNDASVVGRVLFGSTSLLLTGDAGHEVENAIMARFNIDSDLLKVGHHGSKYSTSQEFLNAVTPEYAIIQSGQGNRYGHPAPEVLGLLESAGIQVYRNDQLGMIEFWSDGSQFGLAQP